MSRSRRYFDPNDGHSYRGPSDEMLAADAATELRSMTLLYERYADRLYRYFLLCTADPASSDRMMRALLGRLPIELNRFAGEDRSFGGWLFARAAEVFWRDFSVPSRIFRRVFRLIPTRAGDDADNEQDANLAAGGLGAFDEIAPALKELSADQREVLAIQFGAELRTAQAAEALKLPASLMASHVAGAVRALGDELGVSNTQRLSDDLSDLVGEQVLSGQSRQDHFSLIHGMFLGNVEHEQEEADRAPVFEIGALIGVVILGLIGIWIWGLITEGDTRQHEVATSPPAESASDADPTSTPTVEPEPTAEPSPEVTTEPDAVAAADDGSNSCTAQEGMMHFQRFVDHFNEAEFGALEDMLPGADYELPAESGDLGVPTSDALVFHRGRSFTDAQSALEHFQVRHERGERWNVLDAGPAEHNREWLAGMALEIFQDWNRENPRLGMIIITGMDWSGDVAGQDIAQGRAIVDCDAGLIIKWELIRAPVNGDQSVGADEFVETMGELEQGQSRTLRARVLADTRMDGGGLNAWSFQWSEAILEGDRQAERIDVYTLDSHPVVTYVSDGDRWRLDQRGWSSYGDIDDLPTMPDEIELAVPWIKEAAFLLSEFDGDLTSASSITINEDYSHTVGRGGERLLEIDISSGMIDRFQLTDRTVDGERTRPEIYLLSASPIINGIDDRFDVNLEPPSPERDADRPRYAVPETETEQLALDSMIVGDDPLSERYNIRWNDVEIELTVQPSRGGLDPRSVPESIDEAWTTAAIEYKWGQLVWAHQQFSGYPTEGVWDDGRYRFSVSIDQSAISNDHEWDLQELVALANVLSVPRFDADTDWDVSMSAAGGAFSRGIVVSGDRFR